MRASQTDVNTPRLIEWANRHPDAILDAMEQSMFGSEKIGFCIDCGAEVTVYEGDAAANPCESCGEPMVYASEELAIYVEDWV